LLAIEMVQKKRKRKQKIKEGMRIRDTSQPTLLLLIIIRRGCGLLLLGFTPCSSSSKDEAALSAS